MELQNPKFLSIVLQLHSLESFFHRESKANKKQVKGVYMIIKENIFRFDVSVNKTCCMKKIQIL